MRSQALTRYARGSPCGTRRSCGWRRSRAARDYLGEDVEVIGREELRERLVRGDAILIDVRPQEEYEAGHIEGARSIPIEELDEHLVELPVDRQVVAYCRGPFCALAHEAVRRLTQAGHAASRLDEGWPEWQLASEPAEPTPA